MTNETERKVIVGRERYPGVRPWHWRVMNGSCIEAHGWEYTEVDARKEASRAELTLEREECARLYGSCGDEP